MTSWVRIPLPAPFLGIYAIILKARKSKVLLETKGCRISKNITQNKPKQSVMYYPER